MRAQSRQVCTKAQESKNWTDWFYILQGLLDHQHHPVLVYSLTLTKGPNMYFAWYTISNRNTNTCFACRLSDRQVHFVVSVVVQSHTNWGVNCYTCFNMSVTPALRGRVVTSMYVHQHNRTYQIQIEYTFLQPNTQTKNSIAVKIHPWDKLPDQGTIVLENWYSSIHFWGKRYYCRLSAQHKICCQIVQKSFFLEPVKDKELTSTIYPLSFHFVFLFLLQISLVRGDLKDWCWHLWVSVSGRQFLTPGWSLAFSSNLSLKCELDSD